MEGLGVASHSWASCDDRNDIRNIGQKIGELLI